MDELTLRPWRVDDSADLAAACATSPDLVRQLPTQAITRTDARWVIEHTLVFDEAARMFAIETGGYVVGNVGVSAINHTHGTGWFSYWLAAGFRGRGIATRAAIAVANWALTDPWIFRLELGYRANNPASGAVARAAGFVHEGVERAKLAYDDERFDVVTCARLASDPWPLDPADVTLTTAT